MKIPEKQSVQGSLFGCPSCKGTGKIKFLDWRNEAIEMKCPICKGTGSESFKGKIFIPKKEEGDTPAD